MSWLGIFENIISDIIVLFFAIGFGWVIFFFFNRNKKLKFFGIKNNKRIVIYVANLRVKKAGALGIDNVPRSYEGHAVAYKEMICANQFRDFFNYLVPSLAEKPNILSKLLISDVKVEVLISPLQESSLENQTTFITLGSPAYNVASKYLQDNHHSAVQFSLGSMPKKGVVSSNYYPPPTGSPLANESPYSGHAGGTADPAWAPAGDTGIALDGPSGPKMTEDEKPNKSEIRIKGLHPFDQTTCGFIERINDQDSDRKFFHVAGLSELSTAGAAYHLINHWASLEKKYGQDTYFIRMVNVDLADYRRSTVVFER